MNKTNKKVSQVKGKNKSIKFITKSINFYLIAFIIIASIGVLVYSNSFDCEFQFDDKYSIIERFQIRNLSNFAQLSDWKNLNTRPFVFFTFALNYHFHELDIFGYHLVNLTIHIIMGWFVFLLINLIFSLPMLKSDPVSKHKKLLALFGALICIVHPIQTQAVTYIVQRMTSLAAMFYIISIFFYAKGRLFQIEKGITFLTVLLYAIALLSGFLGILSKQNAVTFPLAILMFELFFIRNKKKQPYKKYLFISFSVMVLIFLLVILTGNLPYETRSISRIDYLITQLRVIVKYIQLLIFPIHQNLDYNFTISRTFFNFNEIGSFVLIFGLLTAGVLLYRKKRIFSFGIFWFFLTLSVESSIIPIRDVIYEHRLYLPMFGYSLCLITVIYYIFYSKNFSFLLLIFLIITFSYGFASYNRNKLWKTKFTMWSDVVKKSPNKARPNFCIANVWKNKGKYDKAKKYYYKALKIDPNYRKALNNLGVLLFDNGKFDEAIDCYHKALKVKPNYVDALNNLGNAWNRKGEVDKAIKFYKDVLEINPNYTQSLNNLGVLSSDKGEFDISLECYEKVLKIKPNDAEVINNLGIVWARKREFDKAIESFKKALIIRPDYSNALKNLNIALQEQKKLK